MNRFGMRIKHNSVIIRIMTILLLLITWSSAEAQQRTTTELQQAQEYFQQGEFEQVIGILEPAVHDYMASEAGFQLLSSAYLQSGNPEAALETARAGQQWFPDSINILLLSIDALRFVDPERAVEKMSGLHADLESGFRYQDSVSEDELRRFHSGVYLSAGNEELRKETPDAAAAATYFKKAAEISPQNVMVVQHLFYAWLNLEKFDDILQRYEQLPEAVQMDEVIQTLRNQALLEEGETEVLTGQIAQRYRDNPSDVNNAIVYGQLLLNQNRLQEANDLFSELLTQHPERREVYEVLLELNRQQLNIEGVASLLGQKIDYFPDDESLYLELARIRGQQERYEEAFELYDELISRFGPDYSYIQKQASLHHKKEGPDAALDFLMNQETEEAGIEFDIGRLHFSNGSYENALNSFDRFRSAEPANKAGWLMHGRALFELNNFEKSAVKFRKTRSLGYYWPGTLIAEDTNEAVENFPDSLYLALKLSTKQINELQEKFEIRVQFALRGAAGTETYPFFSLEDQIHEWRAAREQLFDYATTRTDGDKLLNVLEKLGEHMPDEGFFQYIKAGLYEDQNNVEKALEHYFKAAELNPDDASVHSAAGELLEKTGRFQEAAVWYERALGSRPDAGLYSALIRVHRRSGTLDQLIERWLIRYEAGGTGRMFREYLTDALHRAGRSEKAREVSADL